MDAAWVDRWLREAVQRAASKPLPKSREELADLQASGSLLLRRSLGVDGLWSDSRQPPPAVQTGSADQGGFTLERWVVETQPGVRATVLLYRPKGGERHPVILNPHGHWPLKKAEPVVQARAIEQALCGYLAAVIDSPGFSWEGDRPVERKAMGTHWDFVPTCAGVTATGVYVWDIVRVLDFLESLPYADCTKVGITGESGGGTATVYAFALDGRIRCAVPVVYAASLEVQPDNGCPCNHLPDLLSLGDRAHALALRAPAPVLLIGATDDEEFPPEAVRRTGDKLREMGDRLGFEGWCETALFEGPHTYSEPMRRAALRFFDRHLRGLPEPTPVPPESSLAIEPADSPRLLCDPTPLPSATFRSIARKRLEAARAATTQAGGRLGALGGSGFEALVEASPTPGAGAALVLCDQTRGDLPRDWTPVRAPGLWGERGPSARYCTILGVPTALAAASALTAAARTCPGRDVVAIGPMACVATLLAASLGATLGTVVLCGLPQSHSALLDELGPDYDPQLLPILPLAQLRGDFPALLAEAPVRKAIRLPLESSLSEFREALASGSTGGRDR